MAMISTELEAYTNSCMQIYYYFVMTEFTYIQFDINVYYINRYICKIHCIGKVR